jgi:hypothetical protein
MLKSHHITTQGNKIHPISSASIESVNNKLKNFCQIEHHRHRSPWNFFVNLISGIVAYAYEPCKPCIQFTSAETQKLMSWLTV